MNRDDNPKLSTTDLDNHADQSVVSNKTALITQDFGVPINVSSYTPADGSRQCKTVTGVVGYDYPADGRSIYFHINQALQVNDSPVNLEIRGNERKEEGKY